MVSFPLIPSADLVPSSLESRSDHSHFTAGETDSGRLLKIPQLTQPDLDSALRKHSRAFQGKKQVGGVGGSKSQHGSGKVGTRASLCQGHAFRPTGVSNWECAHGFHFTCHLKNWFDSLLTFKNWDISSPLLNNSGALAWPSCVSTSGCNSPSSQGHMFCTLSKGLWTEADPSTLKLSSSSEIGLVSLPFHLT